MEVLNAACGPFVKLMLQATPALRKTPSDADGERGVHGRYGDEEACSRVTLAALASLLAVSASRRLPTEPTTDVLSAACGPLGTVILYCDASGANPSGCHEGDYGVHGRHCTEETCTRVHRGHTTVADRGRVGVDGMRRGRGKPSALTGRRAQASGKPGLKSSQE
ncbi:hypothetical protein MTO96_045874 [Rhipicephalus appendiculatus]